jgi:polysaccharide deacetylase family protein (PEP-CTERM system associated)
MNAAPTAPAPLLNALTVDVEDYFHPNAMDGAVPPTEWDRLPHRVEHNTFRLLELLDERRVRATFFVLGWVAERWPRLVDAIDRCGHEVASHGYAHRLIYRQRPQQFRADVARGKAILEDRLGAAVLGFRAASYSLVESTMWALDVLIEAGFRYDASIFPIRHDLYGIPSFSRFPVTIRRPAGEIVEVPASTVRLLGRNWPVAGGGYFRLLPYRLTRQAVRHLNQREGEPAIVYVHPWEIDRSQPRLPGSATARFRQYTNLGATEPRLRRLLSEFRFGPLRDALPALASIALAHRPAQSPRAAAAATSATA